MARPKPITQHVVNLSADFWESGRYRTKSAAHAAVHHLLGDEASGRNSYKNYDSWNARMNQLLTEELASRGSTDKPIEDPQLELQHQPIADEPPDLISDQLIADLGLDPEDLADRDLRTFQRREWRKVARADNAWSAFALQLQQSLDAYGDQLFEFPALSSVPSPDAPVLIAHLSDIHCQELIETAHNRFDFDILSQRLAVYADNIKRVGAAWGASKVIICFGGDLMNSDRRLDEQMANAAARAAATFACGNLLAQFITDLRSDFAIECFSVTGNESRAQKELTFTSRAVIDNYDAMIYWFLSELFAHAADPHITFHPLVGNEQLFHAHQQTFLLIHGHQLRADDQRAVQSLVGKHVATGQTITHILCGHIHSTRIGDLVSRNSSMCGGNAYSGEALNLASKAAQNLHICEGSRLHGLKVDLQCTKGVQGYPIGESLQTYGINTLETRRSINSSAQIPRVTAA